MANKITLLDFLTISLDEAPVVNDQLRLAQSSIEDLERAIKDAKDTASYEENVDLIDSIDHVDSEFGWLDSRFDDLTGLHEHALEHIDHLTDVIDSLSGIIYDRLSDEEQEEWAKQETWNNISK